MAADLGISITAKLLESIGSDIVKEVCEMWGYKSQLQDLKETVSTIRKVLLDTETNRVLSNEEQDYISKLKDALYDADDLFDELLTLAELKQLRPLTKSGKFFEKVRCFFSSKNQVGQAYRMSHEVRDIKKRLHTIADNHKKFGLRVDNHKKFGFSVDYKPITRRREETCSYVDVKNIIGRDKDKEAIVNMLLNHNNTNANDDFCFFTIVGVGGLGKTSLAQLVYNDEKIKNEFSDLRLWVCISDQDGEQFDVKTILCKILETITHERYDDKSSMELVQYQFQELIRGKKYLLILDDVWNEKRELWLNLKSFLVLGQAGSKIVVTTRSEMTATIIGGKDAYKLEGLSHESSWCLFEMSAFHHPLENHREFVELGKKIIKKCYNIPLAIKVVGSLLFGQQLSKWRLFEESGLTKIERGDDKIMSILKLSYDNLESSLLKSCFSYCAVFPKDHKIEKQMLIDMWIAQGYIIPEDEGQSIEDVAEEHFLILLWRCFFQDPEKNLFGDVTSVKIHDLMHDVAQEVGREEIHPVNSISKNLVDKIRHVGYVDDACSQISWCSNKIRSYICLYNGEARVLTQIDHWMCLRVLNVFSSNIKKVPDSVGKLMLLRYLNLSNNGALKALPDSITKLHNLQTLILSFCGKLRVLPKDFSKLVKLRHLDLRKCGMLTFMPQGLDKLSSLTLLPFFVVGKRITTEEQSDDELKVLKSLTKINGEMSIEIGENYASAETMNDMGGYLIKMEHLSKVEIIFENEGSCVDHEALLEKLEPHPNLKGLELKCYMGSTIPRWGRADDNWATSFPYLVCIELVNCRNLQHIPRLSELPFLKYLWLKKLVCVKYMENSSNDTEATELATFFPSLEVLDCLHMPMLKGWWKAEQSVDEDHHLERKLMFPRLRKLNISGCPELTSFPPCPSVEELNFEGENRMLLEKPEDNNAEANVDVMLQISFPQNLHSLTFVCIKNMTELPKGMQYLVALQSLSLYGCPDLKTLPDWISCLSSLQSLSISHCNALESLPQAMQRLTSLQRLDIYFCREVIERCKKT